MEDHGLPLNDEDKMHSISLSQAIKYVSNVGNARINDLSEWVVSYVLKGAVPEVSVKGVGPIIHNRKNVSKAHIPVGILFFKESHSKGGTNEYTLLINQECVSSSKGQKVCWLVRPLSVVSLL